MFTPKYRASALLMAVALGPIAGLAQGPGLGETLSSEDFEAWDITIMPNGSGLPSGSGTAVQGELIYAEKCAACHGPNGEGGLNARLVGGEPLTNGIDTGKIIANFWPYATTIFDFTRRAMPWLQPRTLTDNEVYALTAYLLAINNIIDEGDEMNAETLPQVRMPNRDGFIPRFPDRIP